MKKTHTPRATPEYKELWARVGISLLLTDEEAATILDHEANAKDICDAIRSALIDNRYRIEGNTYIPATCITDFNRKYGTEYDDDGEPECEF